MTAKPISPEAIPTRAKAAVRVLHTSDWHLGVAVRNEPRAIDHDAVIAEIISIAERAAPDLIVHTGDLFNGGRPGMADFGRAIRALRDLAEVAPVTVLAGNHDSAVALETLGCALSDSVPELAAAAAYDPSEWCPSRIRVLHRPIVPEKGAVTTYRTSSGARLRFVGLPFVHANRIVGDWEQILAAHSKYTDGIRKICDLLAKAAFDDFDPAVDVAMFASHLHVANARTSTEKEIHVSSEYATDPAHLEGRYGYLAFGHIHIAQTVADGRGRYAGSIIEIDFGEEGETKQVVVADLTPGRPTVVRDIALSAGRRLHRIRVPYSGLAERAEALSNGLVEVTVTPEPDANPSGRDSDDESGIAWSSPDAKAAQIEVDDIDGTSHALEASLEIPGFDSLTEAVHVALPEATVVGVIDARRPNVVVADELELPDNTESPGERFRIWLTESGSPLFARYADGLADPERVAMLFEEIHNAVTTDSDVELTELVQIAELIEEVG